MPPRIAETGRTGLLPGLLVAAVVCAPAPLAAQEELPLQRDYPGAGPFVCPTFGPPDPVVPSRRAEAGQLSSDAVQARILGDLEREETLLARAGDVDPGSVDYAYRHARVLEDLGRTDEAMVEFCRSLSLGSGTSELGDARQRLDDLYEDVRSRIPTEARESFLAGLEQADSSFYEEAISAFTVSMEAAPDWGAPVYNRALMYEYLGMVQESLADYRLYLEIAPAAIDPIVAMVSERIGLLEGQASMGTPSPGGALALGVVPGMGHYYTGRPIGGTVVLGLAVGSLATGFLVRDITVECLNEVPTGGACPPDEILGEITDRPLLAPGVGVAAAVTLIGAIEALMRAKSQRSEAEAISAEALAGGPTLRPPSVSTRGARVDFNLIRISFR